MKKILSLLLAVLLVASVFAACGNKPAENNGDENKEQVQKDPLVGTTSEIAGKIMEKAPVEFMAGAMDVDLTDTSEDGLAALEYMTGLKTAEKISEATVYEAMTGSQAFSLIVVRVKDAADAEAVAKQMKEGVDPRKWICVGADDVKVATFVDVAMLIMVDTEGLKLEAQTYVDAFKDVCGADLDFAG